MQKRRVSISVFQLLIAVLIIIAIIITIIIVRKNFNFQQIIIAKELGDFSGSGTLEDPYKIKKIEDLVRLAQNVNRGNSYSNKYFELVNKLDFQDDASYEKPNNKYGDINKDGNVETIKTELTTGRGFEAIGDSEVHPFEGIFKGNDNTIKNLLISVNGEEKIFSGLFGNNKGTISNLKISGNITLDENVENKEIYIGMLIAKNEGLIQASTVEGNINAISQNKNNTIKVGGITAENTGKIVDTASNVNITASQLKAGISAKNLVVDHIEDSGEIINCTNNGNIKEDTASEHYTAGIVADNQGGNITSCTNNGEITGKNVGGIAGKTTGYIVACQNTGNISNVKVDSDNTETAGGIAGILDISKIENCKNTGNISGLTNVGGIVGENKGTIGQSRNEGKISKIEEVIAKTSNIGGVIGKNNPTAKLIDSKNFGEITSTTDTLVNLGGICGIFYNTSVIENCENNGRVSGSAKIITPNEDINEKCISCANNSGGIVNNADFGELNIGIIYGKFEEK